MKRNANIITLEYFAVIVESLAALKYMYDSVIRQNPDLAFLIENN